MIIKRAEFLTSVVDKKDILNLGLDEYAFVGRSNSGKSSLINSLTNQKKLAKTSSTPGRTRMINYFLINGDKKKINYEIKSYEKSKDGFLLIDLPGYGFSLAGKEKHKLWAGLIEDYFLYSKKLKRVFVLVDIRIEPTDLDKQMINFLYFHQIPFTIVATKSDKIAKSKVFMRIKEISACLKLGQGNVIAYSSVSGEGKDKILKIFEH